MGVYRMKDTECRELIAENLALYRKNSGMTQSELAQKIQYSDKSISKWERGESTPDIATLIKIADLFHITVNDLVYKNKPQPPDAPPEGVPPEPGRQLPLENIPLSPYDRTKELSYMFIHIVGGVLSLIGSLLCIVTAAAHGYGDGLLCSIIYSSTLILYYLLTSLYYGIKASMRAKKAMQILSSISEYMMYAGVSTVFTLCVIRNTHPTMGWIYFVTLWGLCAVGIAMTAASIERYRTVTVVFWGIMIWSILPFYNTVFPALGNHGTMALTAGILSSTISLACFALEKQRQQLHILSNIFTLIGCLFYFICIYFYVI